ncbi:MAG: histidine kinase [Eubacteriales bacterium]|nr:histidine kinase [Eubacteriales bacterium]
MEYRHWKEQLHTLRRSTGFDFAGMASVVRGSRILMVWRAASGNHNRNYLKIVLEPGKGIAGGVFRREKPMVVLDVLQEYSESEIVHSPILLAEDLRSFVAFPLWSEGKVEGVLLFAMRREGKVDRDIYEQITALLADEICGMKAGIAPYEEAVKPFRQEYLALPIYELVDVPVRAALHAERHRIAQGLHDSVVQDLLGVQMQLRTLKYAQDMREVRNGLLVADESLSVIHRELREILSDIKPGIVEDLGLTAAMRHHFRFLEASHGIIVDFRENIGNKRFETEIETVIYRICREAVTNACKYSGSGRIEALLLLTPCESDEKDVLRIEGDRVHLRTLRLEITDEGKGFDTENVRSSGGGMGLPGMHYWAADIGAKLTVRSAPGKGTCVALEIPVEVKEGDDRCGDK